MSLLIGFNCATCGKFIKVAVQQHGAAIAYIADLEPYRCNHCGASHTYGSRDFVDERGTHLTYQPSYPQD